MSTPAGPRLADRSWLPATLLIFVALRVAVAHQWAVELVHHEELFNLRLARQLLAGLPVENVGDFWFTGTAGGTSGGPLLLSFLYVPLLGVGFSALAAIRAAAIGFDVLTLVGLLLLGRELFPSRNGARLAAVAALAMPPSWLWFGLVGKGNYLEGAALVVLSMALLLRAARTGARRDAILAGVTVGFGAWVSMLGVAFLAPAVAFLVWTRAESSVRWLVGGAALGGAPLLLGPRPSMQPEAVVTLQEAGASVLALLSAPLDWPRFLLGVLTGVEVAPLSRVLHNDAPSTLGPGVAIAFWLVLLAWLFLAVRSKKRDELWAAGTTTFMALGLVVGLGAIGVGPETLPVESTYGFDPRRQVLVYPLWALSLAAVLTRAPSRLQMIGALALAVAGVVAGFSFASTGPGRPQPFAPENYVLCPVDAPKDETDVCVEHLDRAWVVELESFWRSDRGHSAESRTAALQGWSDTATTSCTPDLGATADWWRGAGAAARGTCEAAEAARLCSRAPTPELRRACGGD